MGGGQAPLSITADIGAFLEEQDRPLEILSSFD